MNSKLIAACLFALTGAAVLAYPDLGNSSGHRPAPEVPVPIQAHKPRVDVVFVLDTTGSMSGLISTAKEKIWSIATTMASAQPAPEIRMGLVAYRDRGDAYVTRVTDLSGDLDSVYATLMDYRAEGGGDTPESVNAGLAAAVDRMSWSRDSDAYRVVFLVGDAPPHMDYQGEERFPEIVARARAAGIVVNAIRCGNSPATQHTWQQIAALAQGDYFTVDQAGGGVAIATPYDDELASLSAQIDATRLVYGGAAARAEAEAKAAATDRLHAEASAASRARRAAFNATASGARNQFGDTDLISAVSSGKVPLADVAEEALPAVLKPMAPDEREGYVAEQAARRTDLARRIEALAEKRDAYLEAQAETEDDLGGSLDYQLFQSVREQAASAGLSYDSDAPKL